MGPSGLLRTVRLSLPAAPSTSAGSSTEGLSLTVLWLSIKTSSAESGKRDRFSNSCLISLSTEKLNRFRNFRKTYAHLVPSNDQFQFPVAESVLFPMCPVDCSKPTSGSALFLFNHLNADILGLSVCSSSYSATGNTKILKQIHVSVIFQTNCSEASKQCALQGRLNLHHKPLLNSCTVLFPYSFPNNNERNAILLSVSEACLHWRKMNTFSCSAKEGCAGKRSHTSDSGVKSAPFGSSEKSILM